MLVDTGNRLWVLTGAESTPDECNNHGEGSLRTAVDVRPISVMISSQCKRSFPAGGRSMTEIRRTLREHIQGAELFGQKLFSVWINEDAPAQGLEENSWEVCLTQASSADILIVLNTGHAGWTRTPGDVGICHAELMTAQNSAPAKVRIIPLTGTEPLDDEDAAANARFKTVLATLNAFGAPVETEADLIAAVLNAVADAATRLVHLGVREARKGRYYSGDALTWSRLNYSEREGRMVAVLETALLESGGELLGPKQVSFVVGAGTIVFSLHAAPAGLGVPASRERVGRPFLEDYKIVGGLPPKLGPLHLIASQSGATEAQARALLGFPDATVVKPPFGIFAADEVQQVQFAILRDCRDETTTRHAVHRFLDWLRESGEDTEVLRRAAKRRTISDTVAAQIML